jgi:maleate cis-trans isomerase
VSFLGHWDDKNRARVCWQTINNAFLKHRDVDGIYMLGSGWRLLRIVSILEQDLEVPVFYSLAAKLWDVQRRLHVRQPIRGYGRLLEHLP